MNATCIATNATTCTWSRLVTHAGPVEAWAVEFAPQKPAHTHTSAVINCVSHPDLLDMHTNTLLQKLSYHVCIYSHTRCYHAAIFTDFYHLCLL